MKFLELRWGLLIGIANLAWLYGTCYAGLHARGLAWIQVVTLGAFLVSIVGYVFALRAVKRREPEMTYLEGLKSGALVAGVVAIVAALTQVGYFLFVNPGWTATMVEETRKHFTEQGLPADQVEKIAEQSEKTFGLVSYVIQSALGSILLGMVATAIILLFLIRRRP